MRGCRTKERPEVRVGAEERNRGNEGTRLGAVESEVDVQFMLKVKLYFSAYR